MTTEVLRNMIYAEGTRLDKVGHRDPGRGALSSRTGPRGAVWEEVIIHCPQDLQWSASRRPCPTIRSSRPGWASDGARPVSIATDHRPVPLESMYMIRDKMGSQTLHLLPTFVEREGGRTRPNPRIEHMLGLERGRRRRFKSPNRIETVERLAEEWMLPAIYFIFSRAGCDAAAHRLVDAGVRLTDATAAGVDTGDRGDGGPSPSRGRRPGRARVRPLDRRVSRSGWPHITPDWSPPSRRPWRTCSRPGC